MTEQPRPDHQPDTQPDSESAEFSNPSAEFDAHLEEAGAAFDSGNISEARAAVEKAQEILDDNPSALDLPQFMNFEELKKKIPKQKPVTTKPEEIPEEGEQQAEQQPINDPEKNKRLKRAIRNLFNTINDINNWMKTDFTSLIRKANFSDDDRQTLQNYVSLVNGSIQRINVLVEVYADEQTYPAELRAIIKPVLNEIQSKAIVEKLEQYRQEIESLLARENEEGEGAGAQEDEEQEQSWDKNGFWEELAELQSENEDLKTADIIPLFTRLETIEQAEEFFDDLGLMLTGQPEDGKVVFLNTTKLVILAFSNHLAQLPKANWDRYRQRALINDILAFKQIVEDELRNIRQQQQESEDQPEEETEPPEPDDGENEPPEEPPPPDNQPDDNEDEESKRSRIERILNEFESTDDLPLLVFDANSDQITDELKDLYDGINAIKNDSLRNELELRAWKIEYKLRRKTVIHLVTQIEKRNQNPSNFGDTSNNPIENRGFSIMQRLAEQKIKGPYIEDLNGLKEWFGIAKGIHFAWSQIGNSILGTEGGDKGVSRQFPSSFTEEYLGEVNGSLFNMLLERSFGHPDVGEVINPKLSRLEVKAKNPLVEGSGERTLEVDQNATTWVFRKLFDILRKKEGFGFTYLESGHNDEIIGNTRTFKTSDSTAINAKNIHLRFNQLMTILEGAADYEYLTGKISSKIDSAHIIRIARLFIMAVYPPSAIAHEPTSLTDEMYKMYHWPTYVGRDLEGDYANQSPIFFRFLMQMPEEDLPQLESFLANGNGKKFVRFIKDHFQTSNPPRISPESKYDIKDEEVEYTINGVEFKRNVSSVNVETSGPAAFLFNHSQIVLGQDGVSMLMPMQTAPLKHDPFTNRSTTESSFRLAPNNQGPKLPGLYDKPLAATLDDLRDDGGVPIFEAWKFDTNPSERWNLFEYYTNVANNAGGIFRKIFFASKEDFVSTGTNLDFGPVFKMIKYATFMFPGIGNLKTLTPIDKLPDGTPNKKGRERVVIEFENRMRFLFLLSVVIHKITNEETSERWTAPGDAKNFIRKVFTKNPNFILPLPDDLENIGDGEDKAPSIVKFFLGEKMPANFTNEMAQDILEDIIDQFYTTFTIGMEIYEQILQNIAAKFLRH